MRFFLMVLFFGVSLFGIERFSIELLSVQKREMLCEPFMQRVNALDMPFTTQHSGGKYRVLVGDFGSVDEAKEALKQVQAEINEEAFVRSGMQHVPLDPKKKMIQTMVLAQAQALKREKHASQTQELKAAEEILEQSGVQEAKEAAKPAKKSDKKAEEEMICMPTKKALRQAEIARALSFYRASSYYHFSK